MSRFRTRSPSLAIVLTAALSMAATPLVIGALHGACAAKHHDCGKTARIVECCCGHQSETSNSSGPAVPRVTVAIDHSVVPALPVCSILAPPVFSNARVHTSPPSAAPPDLPTLFARLLI